MYVTVYMYGSLLFITAQYVYDVQKKKENSLLVGSHSTYFHIQFSFILYFVTSFCSLDVVAILQFQNEKLNFSRIVLAHTDKNTHIYTHAHSHMHVDKGNLFNTYC